MASQLISLSGQWRFSNKSGECEGEALVPGSIHLDLMREGMLKDPHYGDQELDQFWVGQEQWSYTRQFALRPEDLAGADAVELVCEGLDTLATVRVNGREVGTANNQHRRWVFDLSGVVQAGSNAVEVVFDSVYSEVERMRAKRRFVGNGEGTFCVDGGQYVRKSACNFGWDWGPKCVTAGIWREIGVRITKGARLGDLGIGQKHGKAGVDLVLEAEVLRFAKSGLEVDFVICAPDGKDAVVTARVQGGRARAVVKISKPKLWWPVGYGEQPLYTVKAILRAGSEVQDSVAKRTGLRRVELLQEKDQWGYSFCFRVNGKEIFAKGANWIPADTFVTRVTCDQQRSLLEAAVAANINTIRVWGGGIYEEDHFYDLCDEMGLLVWQDFLFACHAYPAYDAEWMANVAVEAEENVRRLRHHACLMLWCGNNELRHMPTAVNDDGSQGAMSWQEYDALFEKLLPSIVRRLGPEVPYIDGSPCGRPDRRLSAQGDEAGDVHYWGVWWGMQPFESYRRIRPRFCSEFGFQSYPHVATIQEIAPPEEWNLTSYILDFHQRGSTSAGDGNSTIMQYAAGWFRIPRSFEDGVLLSQLCQALAIKYAAEFWRFCQPRCRGIVYWQLNDSWQGQSWSSIDYSGRWKALHYFAREFFAPVLIGGVEDRASKTVEVYAANNSAETITAEWECEVSTTAGGHLETRQGRCRVAPGQSRKVYYVELNRILGERSPREALVWLRLRHEGRILSENVVLVVRPKHLLLQDPGLRLAPARGGTKLTATKAPALWVVHSTREGEGFGPGPNFLCLRRGQSVTLPGEILPSDVKSLIDLGY